MATVHNFEESLEKGKFYEKQIEKYLLENVSSKIEDVSDIEAYQKVDVDFIDKENNIMYEVKTDFQAHKSGNLTYEHISRKVGLEVVGKGCFAKTTANYILYSVVGANIIYKINTIKLREVVGRNFVSGMYTTREILNYSANGEVLKGEVILCPFDTLTDAIEEVIEYDFEKYEEPEVLNDKGETVEEVMDKLFA